MPRKKVPPPRLLLFDSPAALEAYRKAARAAVTPAEREAAVRSSGATVRPVPVRKGRPPSKAVVMSTLRAELRAKADPRYKPLVKHYLESGMARPDARKAALHDAQRDEWGKKEPDSSRTRVRRHRAKKKRAARVQAGPSRLFFDAEGLKKYRAAAKKAGGTHSVTR